MNLETNLLLESCLEPCHLEESHGALAVGDQMQPKNDNILLLAQLDSADMLDTLVAQPNLTGGQPEEAQTVSVHAPMPPSANDPTVLNNETIDPSSNGMVYAMEVQLLSANDRTDVRPLADEPHRIQMPAPAPAALEPSAACLLLRSSPMEKGRTLKIRDSFEAGTPHHGSGSVWSRPVLVKQASRGTGAPEGETLPMPSEGNQALDGSAILSHAEQPDVIPRHAETSSGTSAGILTRTRADNPLGSACVNLAGRAMNLGGHTIGPKTMAEMLRERPGPNGPQVFMPEKITNIGYATTSN